VLNQIAAARLACIGQAPQLPSTVSRIHLTQAAPSRDRGAGLAVGVVPAEARARRVTQLGCLSLNSLGGGLRPRLLRAAGGARGAAIYPRGAGRGLPTGPGTCEAPCGASPGTAPRGILGKSPRGIAFGEVDKKSGAGRAGCARPRSRGRTLLALYPAVPGPLPAFANHGWSWRRKMAAISSADTP
jgi:hypothetical protein